MIITGIRIKETTEKYIRIVNRDTVQYVLFSILKISYVSYTSIFILSVFLNNIAMSSLKIH